VPGRTHDTGPDHPVTEYFKRFRQKASEIRGYTASIHGAAWIDSGLLNRIAVPKARAGLGTLGADQIAGLTPAGLKGANPSSTPIVSSPTMAAVDIYNPGAWGTGGTRTTAQDRLRRCGCGVTVVETGL